MNIDVSTYKDENSKTLMYMSEEKVRDIAAYDVKA